MGYAVSNDVLNPTEPVSYDTRLRNRSKMTRSVARPPRQELDLAYVDLHRPRVGGKTIGSYPEMQKVHPPPPTLRTLRRWGERLAAMRTVASNHSFHRRGVGGQPFDLAS